MLCVINKKLDCIKGRSSEIEMLYFLKYMLFFVILGFSGKIYSASYIINKEESGKIYPLGQTTATTPYMININTKEANWNDRPVGYGFLNNQPPGSNISCIWNKINITSIDGYTGKKIADGILFVIYDSIVSGDIPVSSGTFTSEGKWDSYGKYTQTKGPVSNYQCEWAGVPTDSSVKLTNVAVNASATIKYGVYVSSNANLGTYTIPPLILYKSAAQTSTVSVEVIPGGTLTVEQNMICTISPPAPVDFGTVNLSTTPGSNDVLSYRNGQLTVNCSGGTGPTAATVSVTGMKGRYTDTLKMEWVDSNNTNPVPAEIRGFIGNPLPAGECNGKGSGYTNYITFDKSFGQKLNINNLSNGSNNIPYSFSLCSKGAFSTGSAKANATITIDWD